MRKKFKNWSNFNSLHPHYLYLMLRFFTSEFPLLHKKHLSSTSLVTFIQCKISYYKGELMDGNLMLCCWICGCFNKRRVHCEDHSIFRKSQSSRFFGPTCAYFYVILKDLREPTWKQWREFLVKYSLLPYQLIAEFAWDWLEVHYWTSRFLIVNAMLLSVLELFSFWRIWSRSELK